MGNLRPGDVWKGEFRTQNPATGALTNADSLPVATANHNGIDDATMTLTVTNPSTGRYKVGGTIPSGYSAGDALIISVAATVGGVAGGGVLDTITLDSSRIADFVDTNKRVNVGKWLNQPVSFDANLLPNVNANAVGRDTDAANNIGTMATDYVSGNLLTPVTDAVGGIPAATASLLPLGGDGLMDVNVYKWADTDIINPALPAITSDIPTITQIHDAIISNAFKLAPDATGKLGVNNLPVEFLSSAEQTELTTIINDLVALLGRTDVSTNVASITTNMATMLSRIPAALSFTGANVNANAQVVADKSAYSGTATNLPSDYARNNVPPSWWTAPDNADIVTALADLVILIARADETTPIGAIKAVTDKYINLLNAGGTAFLASALINAPTGSGGGGTTVVDLALTITRNGSNQPVLSWTADPSATAYKIMRSTNGTNYTQIAGVHAPTVTYTDTARPNAVNVFYSIVSVH